MIDAISKNPMSFKVSVLVSRVHLSFPSVLQYMACVLKLDWRFWGVFSTFTFTFFLFFSFLFFSSPICEWRLRVILLGHVYFTSVTAYRLQQSHLKGF